MQAGGNGPGSSPHLLTSGFQCAATEEVERGLDLACGSTSRAHEAVSVPLAQTVLDGVVVDCAGCCISLLQGGALPAVSENVNGSVALGQYQGPL